MWIIALEGLILCGDEFFLLRYRMGSTDGNSKWDSVKRYKLTKMINELSSITGHGTELVSVYVPPRRPIFDVISQL